MADQTIVSLALLKAQWDLNKEDYLETFVPLVVESIRLTQDTAISMPRLRNDMETRFGLIIPHNALKSILKRVKAKGYIKQENKALFPVYSKLSAFQFSYKHQEILQSHSRVINGLTTFCQSEYQVTLTQSEAETALHTFLQADPFLSAGKLVAPQLPSGVGKTDKGVNFLVAAFIQHIEGLRSAEFEHLETIVKGSMLASALYLPDPGHAGQTFHGTDLYFDTSFLIFVLGHAGPGHKEPCIELLTLLENSGVKLSCFSHTYDEVLAALTSCVHRLEKGHISGPYNASMEYFLSEGIDSDDVTLMISHLERDLKKIHIHVRPSIQGDNYAYQIDEVGLRSLIETELAQLHGNAIDRDTKSLSSIMRLWKDRQPMSIEDTPALFVTTNSALARVARTFFAKTISTVEGDVQRVISPCITDHNLTTLLWLRKPTQAPDIPRRRLIADCLAAMQPSRELWTKYEATLDRLVTKGSLPPDDYYLMRYSREAKRALMDETIGDQEAFVEGTVPQIMERARKAMLADTDRELAKERELRILAEGRILEERAKQEEVLNQLSADVAKHEQERKKVAADRAKKYAYFVTLGLHMVGFTLLFVSTWSVSPFAGSAFQLIKSKPLRWFIFGLQVCLFVFTLYNLIWGVSLHSPIKRIERALRKRLEAWFLIETI